MARKLETLQPKFKQGDRVAERPKDTLISAIRPESRERVKQYTSQRFGTVVDTFVKTTVTNKKRTSRQCYVHVLWDGAKTPSQHAQMRICLEEEYEAIRNNYIAY